MTETLVIMLGPDATSVARAGLVVDGRWLRDLEAPDLAGKKAVLVMDGAAVASHAVELPDLPVAKLVKILPGVLDDRLSTLAEARHYAVLEAGEGTARTVAVLDRALMDRALATAASLGVVADGVVPDYMLLPRPEAGAHALEAEGRVMARFADGSGFSAEKDLAKLMLGDDAGAAEKGALSDLLVRVDTTGASLLQGAYAPRGDWLALLVWFRRAGVMAGLALLLWLGTLLYGAHRNEVAAEAYYAQAEQTFRTALPDVGRLVDMRAQMRRAVAAVGRQGGGEFFALSDIVFRAVQENERTLLEGLRYEQENGQMVLSLSFTSFADGEAFRQALQRAGVRVREGSSRQEGARVFSELTIGRVS